jgi:hypothetical protein
MSAPAKRRQRECIYDARRKQLEDALPPIGVTREQHQSWRELVARVPKGEDLL